MLALVFFFLSILTFRQATGTCSDPGFPPHSIRSPSSSQASFNIGDQIAYKCVAPGYDLATGSLSAICLSSGAWSAQQPNCSLIDCGDPGTVIFGYRAISTTTYNSNVTYYCNSTYAEFAPPLSSSLTSVTLTCLANKQWSGQLPSCQRKNCGTPPAVTGAVVVPSGTQIGDTAVYSAEEGYRLSGNVTLTCGLSKAWQPSGQPISTIVTCTLPALSASTNTAWDTNTTLLANYSNNFPYMSRIVAQCSAGYQKAVGDSVRFCQDSGTWSGSPLNCQPITCSSLTVSSAIVDQPSRQVGASATCSCQPGYYYSGIGDETRICQPDGSWAGEDIECLPIPCGDLNFTMPINASANVVPAKDKLNNPRSSIQLVNANQTLVVGACYGDQVAFHCANGTRWARGSRLWQCQSDGTWSKTDPIVCKAVIPLPGIGVNPPQPNAVEAANADRLGNLIVVGLFSGLLAICFFDLLAVAREVYLRVKRLCSDDPTPQHHHHSRNHRASEHHHNRDSVDYQGEQHRDSVYAIEAMEQHVHHE